jgi:LPXTG-motif cell wall-anchored protein
MTSTDQEPGLFWAKQGETEVQQLPLGTYTIVETQAPAGYNPTTGVTVTIDSEGVRWQQNDAGGSVPKIAEKDANTGAFVVVIENNPGVELPSTGGPGTAFYTASGLTLLLGAALTLYYRRRKREQN